MTGKSHGPKRTVYAAAVGLAARRRIGVELRCQSRIARAETAVFTHQFLDVFGVAFHVAAGVQQAVGDQQLANKVQKWQREHSFDLVTPFPPGVGIEDMNHGYLPGQIKLRQSPARVVVADP